jgi:hypothetical protein
LDRNVGNEAGYFGIQATDPDFLKSLQKKEGGTRICIYGYPAYVLDNQTGKFIFLAPIGRYELWGQGTTDWIIDKNPSNQQFRILYSSSDILTSPGQSGAGVFYSPDRINFYVIGVHIEGAQDYSTATWITLERYDKIRKFLKTKSPPKEQEVYEKFDASFDSWTPPKYEKRIWTQLIDFILKPISGIFFDTYDPLTREIFGTLQHLDCLPEFIIQTSTEMEWLVPCIIS